MDVRIESVDEALIVIAKGIEKANAEYRLTQRQLDVVNGIVAGKSNRQIAQECDLVERTVEYHRSRVFGRLGCKNAAELIIRLVALGLSE